MTTKRNIKTAGFLQMVEVPIDELRPDPANPRRISDAELEALTRSLQEFGFVQPVLARAEDKTVIGGHQRLLAARRLGYKNVPVTFLDISPEQARLLNLALNKISGSWDQELLARLLSDLNDTPDVDLSLSGFDDDEVKKLLRSLETRERRQRSESFDLDAALEASRAATRVERGDVWALGDHRLMCGDSTAPADVARLFGDKKAMMAFTDPPYGVSLGDHGGQLPGQRRRRIANDALSGPAWHLFLRAWAKNLIQITAGPIYICMSTREWPALCAAMEESGGHWSDCLVWDKQQFVVGARDYQTQYEPIWYGWPEGVSHYWCGARDQGNVISVQRPHRSQAHPTMKPLPLIERLIENSSRQGDLVADLFLGSGSTLIAAEKTGRTCFGIEIDPHYCSVVLARWESFTGDRAEKLEPHS